MRTVRQYHPFATLFVAVLIGGLWPDVGAAQANKISGAIVLGHVMSQTTLNPSDVPNHQIILVNRTQSLRSDNADWNNVQQIQYGMADFIAGSGIHRGYNIGTHATGDQSFVAYEGKTVRTTKADGAWEAKNEGRWWLTGGTGRFKGITGGGTYRSVTTPTSYSGEWEGEYSLPK